MESRATNCEAMVKAGVVVNGGGVVEVSVAFDGMAEGVLGSNDSAGFLNTFVAAPKRLDSGGLDESPVAQAGFAEGLFFDAAAPNALWVPDANALNAPLVLVLMEDVAGGAALETAPKDGFPNAEAPVWRPKED